MALQVRGARQRLERSENPKDGQGLLFRCYGRERSGLFLTERRRGGKMIRRVYRQSRPARHAQVDLDAGRLHLQRHALRFLLRFPGKTGVLNG